MSTYRYFWLLLFVCAPSHSASVTAHHCADAAGRLAAMRRIVMAVPPQGLSVMQVQQALDQLDEEWKHAFGDTAAQPRFQEAVEEYAIRVRNLVTVAQRENEQQSAGDPLLLARQQEDAAYTELQEQARHACPETPASGP